MYNKERYIRIFENFLTNMMDGNSKSRNEISKLAKILSREYDKNFGDIDKVLDHIVQNEDISEETKVIFFRKLLIKDNYQKLKMNLFELSLK